MDRNERRLDNKKSKITKLSTQFPTKNEGGNGDIVYVKHSTGVFLCVKIDGRWYKEELELV